ncbi:hypothetical protein V2J09_021443 [Rumex salicifolius]
MKTLRNKVAQNSVIFAARIIMTIESYQNQAQVLVNDYLFGDSIVPYTSILSGVLACKVIYDLSEIFSTLYFKSYAGLPKLQRIEWKNRGMSTAHAVFIAAMSLFFVFWSDLFADDHLASPVTFRNSLLSTFTLGVSINLYLLMSFAFYVSVGYFLTDLGLLLWFYPSLGGKEFVSHRLVVFSSSALRFVLHHTISGIAVAYAMLSGEGQLYTFMVLISEVTTPEINMRWFLDTAGLKRSGAYVINGVLIFFAWLVARVLLFVYMFYHVYLHYDQVMEMHPFGYFLVFVVPSVLATMNLMWFGKIIKGLAILETEKATKKGVLEYNLDNMYEQLGYSIH